MSRFRKLRAADLMDAQRQAQTNASTSSISDEERSDRDGKGAYSLAWYAQMEPDCLTLEEYHRLRDEADKEKKRDE